MNRLFILVFLLYSNLYTFAQTKDTRLLNNFSVEVGSGPGNLQYGFRINNSLEKTIHAQMTLFYNVLKSEKYSFDAGLRYSRKGADLSFTYVNISTNTTIPNNDERLVRMNYLEAPIYLYRFFPKVNFKIGLGISLGYLISGTKYDRTVDTLNNKIVHNESNIKDKSSSPFSKTSINNLDISAGLRLIYEPSFTKQLSFGLEANRSFIEIFRYYNYYNANLSVILIYKPFK